MTSTSKIPLKDGIEGFVSDWSSDQRAFKGVPWGKAMMWIFLLSDTFIFSIFLTIFTTSNEDKSGGLSIKIHPFSFLITNFLQIILYFICHQ